MRLVIIHDGEESEVLDSQSMIDLDLTHEPDIEILRFNVKYVVDNLLAADAMASDTHETSDATGVPDA